MANPNKSVNTTTLADGSTATTQSASDNSTKVATTAYVDAATGGSTPKWSMYTFFETTARDTVEANGTSTFNFNAGGASTAVGNGGNGQNKYRIQDTNASTSTVKYARNPCTAFGVRIGNEPASESHEWYVGLGSVAVTSTTSHTWTNAHEGHKGVYASGTLTHSATNANGTTETATSGTAMSANTQYILTTVRDGSTNIKFYTNGALDATHTTNLNSTSGAENHYFQLSATTANGGGTDELQMLYDFAYYSQDMF